MSRDFPEPDWKVLRDLQPLALRRFCDRVLNELNGVINDTRRDSHDRYLAMWKLVEERDRTLAGIFDDLRRSTALEQLAAMRGHDLIQDEEFSRFSDTTREHVTRLLQIIRGE
jgi:hypothetical protein